jgi:type VI protein secretion system component VasF
MSTLGGMHPSQMQAPMKKQPMSAATTVHRRRKLTGWLCALIGIAAVVVTAGSGLLIGHAQSDPEQSPISLPQSSSTMPVLPSAQPPAVTLAEQSVAASETNSQSNPPSQQNVPNATAPAANVAAAPGAASGHEPPQPSVSSATDPKQEVASEAADLLKMATSLKSEVDKSTKDTLSITVVRKANEIEQLAHKVRVGPGKG